MEYEPALHRYHRRRGNGLPKFNIKTLRTAFEKASQKTWKYERPYKLAECNDEKNYEQVLERIDDIEAGRIWVLSPTTRMSRLSCLPQQTPSKLSLQDAPSIAFWGDPHKYPRFKPDQWLSEKEYLFFYTLLPPVVSRSADKSRACPSAAPTTSNTTRRRGSCSTASHQSPEHSRAWNSLQSWQQSA